MLNTQEEQERLLLELEDMNPSSDSYQKTLKSLIDLVEVDLKANAHVIETCTESNKFFHGIKKETIVTVIAQTAVSLLALNFERTGIITSKIFRAPTIK